MMMMMRRDALGRRDNIANHPLLGSLVDPPCYNQGFHSSSVRLTFVVTRIVSIVSTLTNSGWV